MFLAEVSNLSCSVPCLLWSSLFHPQGCKKWFCASPLMSILVFTFSTLSFCILIHWDIPCLSEWVLCWNAQSPMSKSAVSRQLCAVKELLCVAPHPSLPSDHQCCGMLLPISCQLRTLLSAVTEQEEGFSEAQQQINSTQTNHKTNPKTRDEA